MPTKTTPLRLVYLGMNGNFSRLPFEMLVNNGYPPRGLVLPAFPRPGEGTRPPKTRELQGFLTPQGVAALEILPAPRGLLQMAAQAGARVYEVGGVRAEMRDPHRAVRPS